MECLSHCKLSFVVSILWNFHDYMHPSFCQEDRRIIVRDQIIWDILYILCWFSLSSWKLRACCIKIAMNLFIVNLLIFFICTFLGSGGLLSSLSCHLKGLNPLFHLLCSLKCISKLYSTSVQWRDISEEFGKPISLKSRQSYSCYVHNQYNMNLYIYNLSKCIIFN